MKREAKRLTLFLSLIAGLLCLFGCQTALQNSGETPDTTAEQINEQTVKETEEGTVTDAATDTAEKQTEEITEKDTAEDMTEIHTEPPETEGDDQFCFSGYEYADLEQYLQTEWEKQYGANNSMNTNGSNQQISLMVPVIKDRRFELVSVVEHNTTIAYYFCPVDEDPIYADYFDKIKNTIEVTYFLLPSSYEHLVESPEYQFDPQNDAIEIFDNWVLGVDGYCFEIAFPDYMDGVYIGGYVPLDDVYNMFGFEMITYSPTAGTDAIQ